MTVYEIVNKLLAQKKVSIAKKVIIVSNGLGYMSLERVKHEYWHGNVKSDEFDAYCYLWRNLTPRYGNELKVFEL